MAFNPKHLSFTEGKKRPLDLMKTHKVDLAWIVANQKR
jgi:hypothetical protein